MLKLYLLLYADDIVVFSSTSDGWQRGLNILPDYCNKWKLVVIMFFFEMGGGGTRKFRV